MKVKEYISKRVLGLASFVIGLGMAIADGFNGYTANEAIVLTIFGYSAVLLGIDTYRHVKEL